MKLVCHIGTPKTASTFLQNTCDANPDWLHAHGIFYPDLLAPDPNHITLFYANAGDLHPFARDYGLTSLEDVTQFRKTLSDKIAEQVEQAPEGTHTMLVSSENLTGNLVNPAGVARLKDFLDPLFDEVRILIYIRRQDEAILSMYGEFMRRGFTNHTFEEFMENALGPRSVTPYLYYRRILRMWIDVFGEEAITVRKFDRAEFLGGDVLSDFMAQVLDMDTAPDISGLTPSPDDNYGLSAPALEFLRRMHPTISNRINGALSPLRPRIEPVINTLPAAPRPTLSKAQSHRIMQHFRPANTWVKKTFFPDLKGPLFPASTRRDKTGNLGQVSLDEFADFAGRLLV